MKDTKRFAIILSGCGRADGSEIHEAVSLLLAIDQQNAEYEFFAPDIKQFQVVNHFTSEPEEDVRFVLEESARIARGNIKPLASLSADNFDAVVFPGGMGAVMNLCNFAVDKEHLSVNAEVENVLLKCYEKKIVIGAMCIAPVLIAGVLGKYGITVTIGNSESTAKVIENFGAIHQNTNSTGVCVDAKNKIVTTPAYMLANSPKEVYQGAYEMVKNIIQLSEK